MEWKSVEPAIDFDTQEQSDANPISDLSAEVLPQIAGGLRACGLIHIDK